MHTGSMCHCSLTGKLSFAYRTKHAVTQHYHDTPVGIWRLGRRLQQLSFAWAACSICKLWVAVALFLFVPCRVMRCSANIHKTLAPHRDATAIRNRETRAESHETLAARQPTANVPSVPPSCCLGGWADFVLFVLLSNGRNLRVL